MKTWTKLSSATPLIGTLCWIFHLGCPRLGHYFSSSEGGGFFILISGDFIPFLTEKNVYWQEVEIPEVPNEKDEQSK